MSDIAAKYDLKDDKGRIAYAGEIAETLCKLNDPVEREVYTCLLYTSALDLHNKIDEAAALFAAEAVVTHGVPVVEGVAPQPVSYTHLC